MLHFPGFGCPNGKFHPNFHAKNGVQNGAFHANFTLPGGSSEFFAGTAILEAVSLLAGEEQLGGYSQKPSTLSFLSLIVWISLVDSLQRVRFLAKLGVVSFFFQGFYALGRERQSLVNFEIFLGQKQNNQGKGSQGISPIMQVISHRKSAKSSVNSWPVRIHQKASFLICSPYFLY